jgi:hypothetical protein
MNSLPAELRKQILHNLDLPSIKSIRLASRSWAILGAADLLSPVFEIYPYRDDFQRLLEISRHPFFSTRIERINFIIGQLDEYSARHNMFFVEYMRGPEDRTNAFAGAWGEFVKKRGLQELYEEDYLSMSIMREAFGNLKMLHTVDINLTRCLYEHELLKGAWGFQSSSMQPVDVEIKQFMTILAAMVGSTIQNLSHDKLPFQIWGQPDLLPTIQAALKNLKQLKLRIDWLGGLITPEDSADDTLKPRCLRGLSQCLKSAVGIQSVTLSSYSHSKPENRFRFEMLDGFVWSQLHTLVIDGLSFQDDDICNFLIAHKVTLKRLRLGGWQPEGNHSPIQAWHGIRISSENLKDVLTKIRPHLKLEKFTLRGVVSNIRDEDPPRSLFNYDGLYDDDWNLRPDQRGAANTWWHQMEDYVTKNGPWPAYPPADEWY